jgi:hypothetical protein
MIKEDNENSISDNVVVFSDEQFKIAELLIKFLAENNGSRNVDQQTYFFTVQNNYTWDQFCYIRDILIDEGLIQIEGDHDYHLRLKSKGLTVLKIGIKNYFNKKSNSNNISLEDAAKLMYINSHTSLGSNLNSLQMPDLSEHDLEILSGDKLLELRKLADHNLKMKQLDLRLQKHRAEIGMDNTLGKAEAKKTFAELYSLKINKEIEKRKMKDSKTEIHVKENHGVIQHGSVNIGNVTNNTLHNSKMNIGPIINKDMAKEKENTGKKIFIGVVIGLIVLILGLIIKAKVGI